ncbi:flexible cuticle protein 12-like [Photinus pyralis]|uniref:Uncharacterized protein n=1 Tax=Photinus pyralis TaxID=7054 RepID=A0A1Y1KJW7_PHOPY|nr:flexible cuticle protein 12-like [Photinus pyralis]
MRVIAYLFVAFISFAFCQDSKDAKILEYKNENADPSKYYFRFETSNGIFREESGQLVVSESNQEIMVVHGKYSYEGPDNQRYIVKYVADDKGYRIERIQKVGIEQSNNPLVNRISKNAIISLQGGLG